MSGVQGRAVSVTALDLSSPAEVLQRLDAIERDLALRQNLFEDAARGFFLYKREFERQRATALLSAPEDSVTEKRAHADIEAYDAEGATQEAEYEALKAVVRVLETRSIILMALLKSQGRA